MKNNKKQRANSYELKALSFSILIFSFLLLGIYGCKCDNKKNDTKPPVTSYKRILAPAFNADSAYSYVDKQVAFGPRVPNTTSHEQCGKFLISFLSQAGWKVTTQEFEATAFNGTRLQLTNIIASYKPEESRRILLSAHWDTRPFADQDTVNKEKPILGANDGGSGVGILLEIARSINASSIKPNIGIDIILFDGEDYGATADYQGEDNNTYCLGSQYWGKNKGEYSALFGILLDMVGAKDAKFAKEATSRQVASDVTQMVWQTAQRIGYGNYFIDFPSDAIIDDHTYINSLAKIPTIDIIEFNQQGPNYFGKYWHTHNDNMSVIDRNTLKAVGQTLLEVVYNDYQSLI